MLGDNLWLVVASVPVQGDGWKEIRSVTHQASIKFSNFSAEEKILLQIRHMTEPIQIVGGENQRATTLSERLFFTSPLRSRLAIICGLFDLGCQ